jgi:hypothetical protein
MVPDVYGSEHRKQQTDKRMKHRPAVPKFMVCAVPGDMQFQTRIYRQRKKRRQYYIHKEYKPFFVHRFLIAK